MRAIETRRMEDVDEVCLGCPRRVTASADWCADCQREIDAFDSDWFASSDEHNKMLADISAKKRATAHPAIEVSRELPSATTDSATPAA